MEFYHLKFRELRKRKHVSVNYIANSLGISSVAVWRWESGKIKPNEENVRILSKVTQIPLSEISDLKENIQTSNISSDEVRANIIDPVLFNSNNIKGVFDNVLNVIMHLKRISERSASLLKVLLNSNNIMFYIKSVNLNYLAVNDIFLKTLSLPNDCIYVGKNDSAFFTIEEAKKNTMEDAQVLKTGIAIENREYYIPGTRRKQVGLISKFPIFDDANMIIGIAATFIDITNRITRENKNKILSEIIQKLPLGVSVSQNRTRFNEPFFVNSAFNTFGIPDVEMLTNFHESMVKRINPEDVNDFINFVNQRNFPASISIRLSDNLSKDEQWIKYSVCQIDDYYVTTIEDVSKEKKQEEINELFNIYIKLLNKGVRIFDFKTKKYLYVNETVEKLYGRKVEEFYKGGGDFWLNKCVHPDDKQQIIECNKENLNIEELYETTPVNNYRIIKPDGEIKYLSSSNAAVIFKDRLYSLHVETDITEREISGFKTFLHE